MPTPIRVKDEINALKNDADRMVKDISKLSAELTEVGMEQAKLATDEVSEYTKHKMDQLRVKIADANKILGSYAGKLDLSVRSNPYAFIGGAIGISWVLGKFLGLRDRP